MTAPDGRSGAARERTMDRREFVGACASACACVVLGLAAGGCASLVARPVTPVDGRVELALVHYPELTEPGGSIRLLPEGREEPVYVLAQPGGGFAALSPICTHLGCTVEIEGERLVCPCHGSTYDREGAVLQGPAERPLARYRTRLSPDGVLTIDLRSRA
jgi:cytochrome b6-f complex iron-sulfur subunit